MYIKANFNSQTQKVNNLDQYVKVNINTQTQLLDEIQTNTRNQECSPSKQFVQDDIANSKRTKIQADKEFKFLVGMTKDKIQDS